MDERIQGIMWAEIYIHNLIFNKGLPETKVLVSVKVSEVKVKSEYERGAKFAFSEFLTRHSRNTNKAYLDNHVPC
jgi:hypothetical protein